MNRLPFVCGLVVLAAAGLAATGCTPPELAPREVTVVVGDFSGDDASAQADVLRQQVASQGLDDVFVVSGAGQATVCVGHFPSLDSRKALSTLTRIRDIRDARGRYPFGTTMLEPIPEALPPNPWPLENAEGYYTLQVAIWEDPGRAPKAQAYAAQLRAQGYEAYVHHGPRFSLVSIGAFGHGIFDHPELLGLVIPPTYKGPPIPKPQVIDPKVLDLMRQFPTLRMEGQLPPPEAPREVYVACPLISIPGREAPYGPNTPLPEAIYRITLKMVNTRTGLADGPLPRTGVASYRGETQVVATLLTRQLLASLPANRDVRIGIVGVAAMDANVAKQKADATAFDAAVKTLGEAGRNVTIVDRDQTERILALSRHTLEDVLIDPKSVRGVAGLDYVFVGSVTSETNR